jgi:predicted dehydrogenase
MDRNLHVGIIGCGVIAPSHIDSYLALEGVEVVAICDLLPARMEAISARYPDSSFRHIGSASQLLADPDIGVVSVCTDHASHEELVLQAIAAGKHVICEKALTTNLESLKRMGSAAAAAKVVSAGIFQHRFDPVYRVVKDILEENLLGRLLTISAQHQCWRPESYYRSDAWRGTWAGEGGSLLINQSIHFLDILQWVSGGVASVAAHFANLGHQGVIETEDTAAVSLQLKNGALGSFCATSASHREWESAFQIVGTDGDIHIRNGKLDRSSHRSEETAASLHKRLTDFSPPEGVAGAKAYYGTSHPAQIRDFVEAIRSDQSPFVTIRDASEAVELVLAIYASGRSGKAVAL